MFYPWLWYRDDHYAYMTDVDVSEERLYDVRADPRCMTDISVSNRDICLALRKRLWKEMDDDPPRYRMFREGHKWYEYPDVYDPTSQISQSLRSKHRDKLQP